MAQPSSVELNPEFSSPDATATPWPEVERQLAAAELYWISTVRPDGRPHVTPLIAMWMDDALFVCSGPTERKVRNLARNPACVLTTGTDAVGSGRDIVVEGHAERVLDRSVLERAAAASVEKYGPPFDFRATDAGFAHGGGGEAHVFRVRPVTVFAFGKGDTFSQPRYRFTQTP